MEKFSHPSHQSHHISSFNIKNLLASPLEEVHTIYHLSLQFLSLHKKTNQSVKSINQIRVCFLFIFFQGSFFSKNEKTLKKYYYYFVLKEQHLLFPKLLVHQTFIFSVINHNLHPIFSLPHSLWSLSLGTLEQIFFSFQNNTGSEN